MRAPKDSRGNPIAENDTVRVGEARAQCDVVQVVAGGIAILRWPAGYYTKEPTKNLTRVNQHPITPTPMSASHLLTKGAGHE